jgi:hypothetical protein
MLIFHQFVNKFYGVEWLQVRLKYLLLMKYEKRNVLKTGIYFIKGISTICPLGSHLTTDAKRDEASHPLRMA